MPASPSDPITTRRRDAESSRRTILDAAEALFAGRGFDGASLQSIGRAAGVSAALPAYFFGDKEGLYRAVMERLLAEREARRAPGAAQAVATLEATGDRRAALEILIGGYIDFLRERPGLVRLMGREALDGGRRLGPQPRHSVAVEGVLARLTASPAARAGPSVDARQLLITTVAICFFPIEHNDTMLAAMGLDATSESFTQARKQHVVDLLVRVLGVSSPAV
jgi:TetR/AcrR family transcriptional regulator